LSLFSDKIRKIFKLSAHFILMNRLKLRGHHFLALARRYWLTFRDGSLPPAEQADRGVWSAMVRPLKAHFVPQPEPLAQECIPKSVEAEGYSQLWWSRTNGLFDYLMRNPDQRVVATAHTIDYVCSCCQKFENRHCDELIDEYKCDGLLDECRDGDERMLAKYGLKAGKSYTARELFRILEEKRPEAYRGPDCPTFEELYRKQDELYLDNSSFEG
jgi:hypothetical protein